MVHVIERCMLVWSPVTLALGLLITLSQPPLLMAPAVAAEQVIDLTERGVRDFHFYTMNKADLVFAICHLLGLRAKPERKAA